YDFGELMPARLSGHVYHDADNDGVRDPGEAGIGNVEVTISCLQTLGQWSKPAPITVVTDASGFWTSGRLMAGTYQVTEKTPGGYFDGLDAAGTAGGTANNPGDLIENIHLASGQVGENYDFGELMPVSIAGRVFVDINDNGGLDAQDELLPGVTVHLLNQKQEVIDTITTNWAGEYRFANLRPGVYGVHEVQPEEYYDGDDYVGSAGGLLQPTDSIIDVTLASSVAAVGYDFSELAPGSISGRVYVDANGNGILDKGERLLPDVTVHLLGSPDDPDVTTQTDANGAYSFDGLAPKVTYELWEEQPAAYFDGPDQVGSVGGSLQQPDAIIDILLPPGTDAVDYDFREIPRSSISGYVYLDDNDNGVFESDVEVGIPGVRVTLLDADGKPTDRTTTTDASGYYRFSRLAAGVCGVAETQPAQYYDGRDTAGSVGGVADSANDRITGASLKAGVDAHSYNFGELRPASLSGRVHAELNGNDVADPGEPLLSGVTIYLLDASGRRIAETATDQQGEYIFANLRPGTYGAEEIQPDEYLDGNDLLGSEGGRLDGNDRMVDVTLGSGVDAVEYNFCELVPASLSGYVFQDGPAIVVLPFEEAPEPFEVRSGRLGPDSKPIGGVVIRLGDASGVAIEDARGRAITTVTDAGGYYEFTMLEPGLYTVLENQPDGYVDSIDTPGSKGGMPVNPHEELAPLALSMLSVDAFNDAIVRIPLDLGDVAVLYNFSEVVYDDLPLDIPPPPIPTPPPEPAPLLPEPAPPAWLSPLIAEAAQPLRFDVSGGPAAYTWHLSVIDAGWPRGERAGKKTVQDPDDPIFDPAAWTGEDLGQSQWTIADSRGVAVRRVRFGHSGATPVAGDFNGDGIDEVGVFYKGHWFLDLNGNGVWDDGDFWARLGDQDDQPVVGDWDGDGKDDIGIFGPAWDGDEVAISADPGLPDAENPTVGRYKNVPPEPHEAATRPRIMKRTSRGDVRADLIDHVFHYGNAGDKAVAGDFNGDGVTNIGIFHDGTWVLDSDGNGRLNDSDETVRLGRQGDVPVVGDFNGDGTDDLGVYRNGTWYLDINGDRRLDAHDKVFELGGPRDKPAVGDFNGDGTDEIAIYRDTAPFVQQPASGQPASQQPTSQ
ncbi:MAG: hypothetical protein JXB62_17225, partial [Pirellulales bacterium]|nr:hypothetical protein [Pirellulales bacterium]